MTGFWILMGVLAALYIAPNLWRLRQGRPWAFTYCQAAREWDQRERERERGLTQAD